MSEDFASIWAEV